MTSEARNICPFCKKQNNCQHQNPSSCWCMTTKIPESLLKLLPKESEVKSCVCKDCITFYSLNSEEFIKKYCAN